MLQPSSLRGEPFTLRTSMHEMLEAMVQFLPRGGTVGS